MSQLSFFKGTRIATLTHMRAAACHSGKGRAAIEWESILKDLRKKNWDFSMKSVTKDAIYSLVF